MNPPITHHSKKIILLEKPNEFDNRLSKGILKGERTISTVNDWIPKQEEPILAAMHKKIVTDRIDIKINIQDGGSNSFTRFQVGATLAGYAENQYRGS